VQDVTALAGGRGNSNAGFMFMSLKPDAERLKKGDTAQVIVDRLRPKVSDIPGAILYLQAFQDLRIGGRNTATEYQYTLTADSLKDLNEWGPKLKDAMDVVRRCDGSATAGPARAAGDRSRYGEQVGSVAADD
jgi:multidrug efflux pump subunit AcrB